MVTQVKGSVTADIDSDIADNTSAIATNTSDIGTINSTLGTYGTAATKDFGTADGNLPEYQSAFINLDGDFNTASTGRVHRIGNIVTFILDRSVAFDSAGTIHRTSANIIPVDYRSSETIGVFASAGFDPNDIFSVRLCYDTSDHSIFIQSDQSFANWSGGLSVTWEV